MKKTYLLYGLGRSNLALYKLISYMEPKSKVYISGDFKKEAIEASLRPHYIEPDKALLLKDIEVYIVPGISPKHQIYKTFSPKNEIDYASQFLLDVKFIGVTGSVGKSSTVAMLGQLIEHLGYSCYLAGNFGIPLSDLVLDIFFTKIKKPNYIVLELSSFQLYVLEKLKLECAVLLNLEKNHLDWHSDYNEYKQAKLKIFDFLIKPNKGFCTKEIYHRVRPNTVYPLKSKNRGLALVQNNIYFLSQIVKTIEPKKLAYKEAYTICIGVLLELNIFSSLKLDNFIFKGLAHRFESLGIKNNIHFINDSKATTINATLFAIKQLHGSFSLILGGKSKGTSMLPLFNELSKYKDRLRLLVLYGDIVEYQDEISQLGFSLVFDKNWHNMLDKLLLNKEKIGDNLLLSPAMSSLDQFNSFAERGEAFKEFIQRV